MKRLRENYSTDGNDSQDEMQESSPSKKNKIDQESETVDTEKARVIKMLKYQEYKEDQASVVISELRETSSTSLNKVIEKSRQRKEKKAELKKTGRMRRESDRMNEFERNIKAATKKDITSDQDTDTVQKSDQNMDVQNNSTMKDGNDMDVQSSDTIGEEVLELEDENQITSLTQSEQMDDDEFESVMDQNTMEDNIDYNDMMETDAFDEALMEPEQNEEEQTEKTFVIQTDIPDEKSRKGKEPEQKKEKTKTRTSTTKRKTKNERQSDLEVYKLHLATFLAYSLRRNTLADSPVIQGLLYSMIPDDIHKLLNTNNTTDTDNRKSSSRSSQRVKTPPKPKSTNELQLVQKIMKWFRSTFEIIAPDVEEKSYRQTGVCHMYNMVYQSSEDSLSTAIQDRKLDDSDSFIVLLSVFRCLGLICRQVAVINPDEFLKQLEIEKRVSATKKEKKSDKQSDKKEKKKRAKKKKNINHNSSDEDVDEYIEETKKNKKKSSPGNTAPASKETLHHNDLWLEMFSNTQKAWIRIDPELYDQTNILQAVMNTFKYKKPETSPSKDITKDIPTRISDYPSFVVACGRDNGYVNDITYNHYICKAKDTISGHEQFDEAYSWFRSLIVKCCDNSVYEQLPDTEKNLVEDEQTKFRSIREELMKAIPKTQDAFKAHPLYIIEKWITRYEALYPSDPPAVGKCGKHTVYSRSYLHLLHTKDRWIKDHGKQVKSGEKPYKVVKASHLSSGANCELYGEWQTEDYTPPVASDGIVPKNERGQVDLWHERMLPTGTVHLNLKGVGLVAKKLKIDYAPAMTGFEVRQRRSVPKIEGIVICAEYEDILRDAYIQNQRNKLERLKKKKEQRITKNWRRLVLRMLARQDINSRFGHLLQAEESQQKQQSQTSSASQSIIPDTDDNDELGEGLARVNGVIVEYESIL